MIERSSERLARVGAQGVVDRVGSEKHECRNAHQQSAAGLEHAQLVAEIRGFVGDVLKYIRGHQEIKRSIRVSRPGESPLGDTHNLRCFARTYSAPPKEVAHTCAVRVYNP